MCFVKVIIRDIVLFPPKSSDCCLASARPRLYLVVLRDILFRRLRGVWVLEIDIEALKKQAGKRDRYTAQLDRLQNAGKETLSIEAAVESACDTLASGTRSFVIYGEPQSGKTEMMICLTAKLLDEGHRIVIHLLNDSVQLLQQNLERFQRSMACTRFR